MFQMSFAMLATAEFHPLNLAENDLTEGMLEDLLVRSQ